MRAIMLASLAAVGIVVGVPAEVRASCMMPSAAVFPLADTVPPQPLLYVFEVGSAATALQVEGPRGPVAFTTRDVSEAAAGVRVTEIRVDAKEGWFIVSGWAYGAPRRFDVVAAAAPGPIAAVAAGDVQWKNDAWTCSHTTGLEIAVRAPGVAAFRVAWPGHEALVPPSTAGFFLAARGGEIDPSDNRVFLGHPSCVADLIDPAYIGRRDFRLFAIFADGSEQEVTLPRAKPAPVAAEPPAAWTPLPPAAAQPPAAPAILPPPANAHRPWWLVAAGAGGLGALCTIGLVLLVRRRRTVAVP